MKFKSIKLKYTMIGLVICLISLLLTSIFSYLVASNIASDLCNKRIHEVVTKNSIMIDAWFNNRKTMIDILSQDIEASQNFTSAHLMNFVKSKVKIYKKDVIDCYIGYEDNKKKLISGVDWTPPADYDCTKREWYKRAKASNDVIFTEPYIDAMTKKLIITVAKSIKNKGEVVGVIATDIYLSEVIKAVEGAKISENSYGMLFNSNGKIVIHPQKLNLFNDKINLFNNLVKDKSYVSVKMKDYDGQEKIFNFSKINSNGWYFGIAVSTMEYQKPLKKLFIGFILAFVMSMIIGSIIMINLMNTMIKPIKYLNNTLKAFSLDMTQRVKVLGNDELGELSLSFNHMADTIEEYSKCLESKVEERTRELKQKNDLIIESIEYARAIQKSIIPDISDKLMIPREKCFSIWKPRDIVGGDIYWCKGNENEAMFILADCTGHGVPGALMSMMLTSILDTMNKDLKIHKPSKILNKANKKLKEALNQDNKDCKINDGADMAVFHIDKKNNKLTFSGAKLNLFIYLDSKVTCIKGTKFSVGYSCGKSAYYEDIDIPYNKKAVYYLTTDGYLDQNCERSKYGLGKKGFMDMLEKIGELDMQTQKKEIEEDISLKINCVPQRDDITIIGLKLE